MAPKRQLGRHSFFDAPALLAFLEDGLGSGKRDTAERHRRTIQAAAVAAADRGQDSVDLSVTAIPNLPAFARERLPHEFALLTSSVDSVATSRDGTTTKFVVKLQDGHRVESVLMRHDGGRNTLCVSSQVGCKMGCTFCATGTFGELGNLTSGEILEQLAHARAHVAAARSSAADEKENVRLNTKDAALTAVTAVTNIVFMGMGEPLNNYEAVCASIGPMSDARGFAVAPSRVTVSTVGVVPKILALTRDHPEVRLALSLHAPNQALREKIVPTASAYPLPKIMDALDAYLAAGSRSRTRAMIEYCVLGGVNDREAHARELGELLRGRDVIVNLIPFNPTDTPMSHVPPTHEAVQAMAAILAGPEFGHRTTVRKEMGQDIAGACGQLALNAGAGENTSGKGENGDLEDLAGTAVSQKKTQKSLSVVHAKAVDRLGKGSVVQGCVVSARTATKTPASRSREKLDQSFSTQMKTTKKPTGVPRDVELAVAFVNATALVSMITLALASAWKVAAYAGWLDPWFDSTRRVEL